MKFFLIIIAAISFLLFPKASFAQEILTADKLITVDIGKQRLYAWEGGQVIKEFVVSTGMRYTPTLKGSFKIRSKVDQQNMKGSYPPYEPYFIKDVKHVMYYSGAYAIHGAHWHNKFGSRVTHGCVNLRPADAEWLYNNFAHVGTRVEIF